MLWMQIEHCLNIPDIISMQVEIFPTLINNSKDIKQQGGCSKTIDIQINSNWHLFLSELSQDSFNS